MGAEPIEVLNIHRTPLHVKTLLAIAKLKADSGPVNRAEMLTQFLFLIFQNNINFSYETIPDLKDSAFALGFFCAQMLQANETAFTKKEFVDRIEAYCKEKAVDLDVQIIFELLDREKVIVKTAVGYVFRYSYWLYFFAAHHMYANSEFKSFVLNNCTYSRFPEVIEFYSAIDRHRVDLIETLTTQIRDQRKAFEARSKVPIGANLYDRLNWKLDEQDAAKLAEDVNKFLDETDLPTEVKDQLADKKYDYQKPYRQNLRSFIDSQTLAKNLAIMVAAARALRNSDHVDKAEKLKLLREILFIWKQLVQTGLLLANEMVSDSVVSYEGVLFIADWAGKAEQSPEQRLTRLIYAMPLSASRLFYADLATRRMGPLFDAALTDEQDQILRFFTVMQVVLSKPKDWVKTVGDYIAATKSGSFYLWSLQTALRTEHRTAFNSPEHKEGLRALLVRIVAKHQLDISYPNAKTTRQIEQGIKDQLDK